MKSFFFTLTLMSLLAACTPKGANSQTSGSDNGAAMDSLSYSVGVLVAQNLKAQGLDEINPTDLANAIEDVIEGKDLKIDAQTANANLQTHMQGKAERAGSENKSKGEDFLAENGKRAEVKTLESGLQYEVLTEGTGKKPAATDKVTVHYHGTLINGTVFDSSVDRGEPASFPVNGVIPGWVEALQLMPTGSKWKLFIPSDLAYGARGAGGDIGPNSTLVFDVELISIN
ncbi:MAG: FKBP-type peptidyl-prolyl cis-trans isomerase FklB [Saprospiraceae bacterium]|jgi:FKBP-type peptidyl-prolyl cis-trans isomerase FklB